MLALQGPKKRLSILVFHCKAKITNRGFAPVYMRFELNHKRVLIDMGVPATPDEFDTRTKRLRLVDGSGTKLTGSALERVKQLNTRIQEWENFASKTLALLESTSEDIITPHELKAKMLPTSSRTTLIRLYCDFITEQTSLVGVDIAPATLRAGKVRQNRFNEYLEFYKLTHLHPKDFTPNMADKYLHWLLLSQEFQRNTALRHIRGISQVLQWGVRRELLERNPLENYEYKLTAPKEIVYLNSLELDRLSCHEFASYALGVVRDCFVLQCWTGLAYADLSKLDIASCVEEHNGRRYLRVRRQKSTVQKGYECMIPLLPEAERILQHYGDKMPVFCNAVYNRYLKEVAQICGIDDKCITTHVGRKTAGMLLLNAGLPIGAVSKILGHSSVRMTETVYARILDKTVVEAIDTVFGNPPMVPAPLGQPAEKATRVIQPCFYPVPGLRAVSMF